MTGLRDNVMDINHQAKAKRWFIALAEMGPERLGGLMRKGKAAMSLEEVFSGSEKDPRWKAAYEKADIEVRMAIQIAKARERAHLTQSQLAKAVGTTQSVISRIERADQNLTLGTLSKIANALHSSLVVQLR